MSDVERWNDDCFFNGKLYLDSRNQLLMFLLTFLTLEKNCRQGAIVGKLSPVKGRPIDLGFLDLALTLKEYGQINGFQDRNIWGH